MSEESDTKMVVRESMVCRSCGKRLITRVLLDQQMVSGLVLRNTRSGCCHGTVTSVLAPGPAESALDPIGLPKVTRDPYLPPGTAEFAVAGPGPEVPVKDHPTNKGKK